MLSVDCWRHIVTLLGYRFGDEIISLSLVCKNAYKAVRENGTQFLRWKITQDFVTSLAQHRYPWFKLIRAVTVCYDDMSFAWTRTERKDIDDYKVVVGLKTGFYKTDGSIIFSGMKRLHIRIMETDPEVVIDSLPYGLESFELSSPDSMTERRIGETRIPDNLPSTLMRLVFKTEVSPNEDVEMPRSLKIFKSKNTSSYFYFSTVPIDNELETLSIVTNERYGACPHEGLDDSDYYFPNVKKLKLIDASINPCKCKSRNLHLQFPALRLLKTHRFSHDKKCPNRKEIDNQKILFDGPRYSHVRVEFK